MWKVTNSKHRTDIYKVINISVKKQHKKVKKTHVVSLNLNCSAKLLGIQITKQVLDAVSKDRIAKAAEDKKSSQLVQMAC